MKRTGIVCPLVARWLTEPELQAWDYLHDPLKRDRNAFDEWLMREHIAALEALAFARERIDILEAMT